MTTVFDDLKDEIELFFNDLNWTFILIFVFVLYGIKNKEEFQWFNDLLKGRLNPYKVWIAGLIITLFFSFFKFLEGLCHELRGQTRDVRTAQSKEKCR